jgi:hypothetical protein
MLASCAVESNTERAITLSFVRIASHRRFTTASTSASACFASALEGARAGVCASAEALITSAVRRSGRIRIVVIISVG